MLIVAIAFAAHGLVGRSVVAPEWLRARIEERVARLVPGAEIGFGDIAVEIGRDGTVRARLFDAALRAEDGAPIAVISELSVGAAAWPLLSGRVALREAGLSGAFLSVRREEDGKLGIGLGLGGGGGVPSVPEVLDRIDAALDAPRLAGLDRVVADGLTIRYTDVRADREWIAEDGRLTAARDRDALRLAGNAVLSGDEGSEARLELNAESGFGTSDLSFGLSLDGLPSGDIATQSPALAWLDALRAPISGALRGWMEADGDLGGLDATLRIGAGVLQPSDAAEPVPFDSARTYFSFDPARGALDFSEIAVESPLGRVRAEGRATLSGLGQALRPELVGQFTLTGLHADPGAVFSEPLDIARAETEFRLRLDPFRVEVGRLRIDDPEVTLRASGRVAADAKGWSFGLDATAPRASPAAVAAHWPLVLAPKTRDWFVQNVAEGEVRDAIFALRRAPGGTPELYLDFRFEDAKVRFADTLPPAETASGQFTIWKDRLSVAVETGQLVPPEGGPVDISGTTFVIPDTEPDPGTGELSLVAEGSVTAGLSLLDQPPLEIMSKAGRPVDLAEGRVRIKGTMVRPLGPDVDFPDVAIAFEGRATDVSSDALVPGRTLAAEALDISVTNERVRVSGRGTLSGVPFDGSWTQPLGTPGATSRVEGDVTLSAAAARAFGVALPDGMVSGSGPGRIEVDLPASGPPRFELSSSLSGLGLALPQAGWALGRGSTGTLEVAGRLGSPAHVDRLRIDAGGLDATGEVALTSGGQLDRLSFGRVRIGNWFDAPVTLRGRGAGAAPELQVTGGSVDLRGLDSSGGGGGAGGGTPISLALDRLTVAQGIALKDMEGRFVTSAGGLDGGFSARMVETGAPVRGQLLPQNGGTGLRLSSEDAGDVLESTGILKTVAGGHMVLNLTPVRGAEGTYDGAVTVTEARLRDAPAIGALLDAISIVGIIDQLEGPGIYFQNVEARFRLSPQRVVLSQSSATGPSMGISMDGYYDLGSGRLDMQGVLSPIYVLNSIGSIFTRRGEGLLGFNFNLRGTAARPEVAVNPLSVFTPGMFREIFRRPPPDLSR